MNPIEEKGQHVNPEDVLAGVQLQREIEQAAFRVSAEHGGKPYEAPSQRVGSFLGGSVPVKGAKPAPTYARGVIEAPIAECFPPFVSESLAQALPLLGRKLKGFDDPNALMTAPETRCKRALPRMASLLKSFPVTGYILAGKAPASQVASCLPPAMA